MFPLTPIPRCYGVLVRPQANLIKPLLFMRVCPFLTIDGVTRKTKVFSWGITLIRIWNNDAFSQDSVQPFYGHKSHPRETIFKATFP